MTDATTSPSQTPTPDQAAAHEFLTELRTRITIQPLPYQYGVEARALESLWEVFAQARDAVKTHPGCEKFAEAVTRTLNLDIRPVTAKWHRAHAEGRLNSRDGANAFRADLERLQIRLRRFASELHEMAYGERVEDPLTPSALPRRAINSIMTPLPFGIVLQAGSDALIPSAKATNINASELEAVTTRRGLVGVSTPTGMDAVGLALSGGGIRSATFCLGVVQVLAERRVLKDVDFLSTVSGGGYTGSFLTMRLGKVPADHAGASQHEGFETLHASIARPDGPDPPAIRYLRQHAKYLAATDLKQRWSMVTATLAGMVLNWSAPLVVTIVAALAAALYSQWMRPVPWATGLKYLGLFTGVILLLYCWSMRCSPKTARNVGRLLAGSVAATVLLGALWLLLDARFEPATTSLPWWRLSALASGLIAAGPTILRLIPVARKPVVRKALLRILLLLAAVVVPLGALVVFYTLWHFGAESTTHLLFLAGAAVVLQAIASLLININLTGLHRLYRDHLARTFVQTSEEDESTVPLPEINPGKGAPYHLINTTLNVPSSRSVALRERRSDFFVFSKHWCGSPSTGYFPTKKWKTNSAEPDLATAMAVSGAAASSHMGLGSQPTLRALLTFLNVRLGFWIVRAEKATWLDVPGFLCLIREMTGIGMSDQHKWLNLSDGGHIENLGIYELLRRRCKFIICVDGEADPELSFHGLMTLVRHAQIDFGVQIVGDLSELRLDATTRCSRTHAVLCRVHYPDIGNGPGDALLLYVKLSVTGNEPELIRRYRLLHPDFPHQSTLDQFFDEEQFEAYRQLGVHVADGLFHPALVGTDQPRTVPKWFEKLAGNLLDPEYAQRLVPGGTSQP